MVSDLAMSQANTLNSQPNCNRPFKAVNVVRFAAEGLLSQATGSGRVIERLVGLTTTHWVGKEQCRKDNVGIDNSPQLFLQKSCLIFTGYSITQAQVLNNSESVPRKIGG
jgi:hypothetical protein